MNKKFIEEYDVNDYEIWTDTGWEDCQKIYKTIPFDIWKITTESGKYLHCADDHYVIDANHNKIFVKDCTENVTKVITEDGFEVITKVEKLDKPPENMYDVSIDSNNHTLFTNKILSHNTTIMTIYALWSTCFEDYKRVVIVANKEATAIMILRRISLAYEEMPNWLKPGAIQYGKKEIIFSNHSSIGISTTTGSAIRGESVNTIIIDEMSHIDDHISREFWASVIPVISSSKKRTTKIFAVSTPNGTGNLFYEIYTKAEKGIADNEFGGNISWHSERIDWWEVPGRGKKWKQEMLQALGNDETLFKQEFENTFIESGNSAVDTEIIKNFRLMCREPLYTFEDKHYYIWEDPQPNHIYAIGCDVSEGIGKASSVAQILDFTDLSNIKQVGMFFNNAIHPLKYAETLHRICGHWGNPPILIERNNIGSEVIDNLETTHNYHNIVSYNPNEAKYADLRHGIYSTTSVKYTGVMNMRYWINTLRVVNIFDIGTIQEMETFVRYPNGTWKKKPGDNIYDDRVMSLIWALFLLDDDIVKTYYDVVDFDDNGKPLKISSYTVNNENLHLKLDPLFQKDPNAPLPSMMGWNDVKEDSEALDLRSAGWRKV